MNICKYWEAKLQLRPYSGNIIDYVRNQANKNKGEIVEEVRLKEGLDVYFDSRKLAVSIARKLKKVFKGEMKISTKLFTKDRMSGKQVNRVTVLFRKS